MQNREGRVIRTTDKGLELNIRAMTESDISTGMRFKELAGWNQLERDWERFLSLSSEGCFVGEADGEPVGTVVTVVVGGRAGWVAMVLVPPEHRRKGIGSTMLSHGIEHLQRRDVEVVKLDATPMGREVYLGMGFEDEYRLVRMEGLAESRGTPDVRSMRNEDLGKVASFDAPYYGVDREDLLQRLFEDSDGLSALFPGTGDRIEGYGMIRPGSGAFQIGPVVAATKEAAEALFSWAMGRLSGSPVFFDVPVENKHVLMLAKAVGFSVQREFTRMFMGDDPLGGNPRAVLATSGPEKG